MSSGTNLAPIAKSQVKARHIPHATIDVPSPDEAGSLRLPSPDLELLRLESNDTELLAED